MNYAQALSVVKNNLGVDVADAIERQVRIPLYTGETTLNMRPAREATQVRRSEAYQANTCSCRFCNPQQPVWGQDAGMRW